MTGAHLAGRPDDDSAGAMVRWHVSIVEVESGTVLSEHDATSVFPAASAPKVLLLLAAARLIGAGVLDPAEPLDRRSISPVGDSGLWQHLRAECLTFADACALVGAVSDNVATNVLLRRVGIGAIDRLGEELGLEHTRLHDEVRDQRDDELHPPSFSSATGEELTSISRELARPRTVEAEAAALVRTWLATGVDVSLVAGAFGLDPLAHSIPEPHVDAGRDAGGTEWRGPLFHKTGSDPGVRVDTGVLRGEHATIGYTVAAEWAPAPWPDPTLDQVVDGMRQIGRSIRRAAYGGA